MRAWSMMSQNRRLSMDMRVSEGRKWVLNEDGSSEIDPPQGQGPVALLDSVLSTPGYQGPALNSLLEMVKSNEIRDYGDEFTELTYERCFDLLVRAWKDGSPDLLQAVEWIVSYIVAMPEFDKEKARASITSSEFIRAVLSRFETAAESEHRFLRELLHFIYLEYPDCRRLIRALIGRFLVGFTKVWEKSMAVSPILEVLGQIIKGFRLPLTEVHRALLLSALLPLHKSNEMYEWRDQIPLLQTYHEPLVFCIRQYLDRDRSLAVPVVEAVLKAWPDGFDSNSPKEVLCLHEIEGLLKYLTDEDFSRVLPSLLPRLARCLKTDHSRCLEKVLQLWKDPSFAEFSKRFSKTMIPALMPNIYRHGEVHWNVTVNKMRGLVLDMLHDMDPTTFARVAASLTSHSTASEPLAHDTTAMQPPARPHHFGPPKNLFQAGAGGWKPPSKGGAAGAAPPSTITGVAPWAMPPPGSSQRQPSLGMKPQPTGVAPWAVGETPGPSHFRVSGAKMPPVSGGPVKASGPVGMMMPPPAKRPMAQVQAEGRSLSMSSSGRGALEEAPILEGEEEEEEEEEEEGDGDKKEAAGAGDRAQEKEERERSRRPSQKEEQADIEASEKMDDGAQDKGEPPVVPEEASEAVQRMLDFIKKLRPEGKKEGEKTWHDIQLEATPTFLPDLRFHDLVFGHDLGSGAFSTVKYARLITKGKTRSEWAEYAIKVISTSRIEELGYESCVSREIAVLRLLAHPGIARMVSAFRWRDGAYLVLEYASKGDLHTHIVANGSLSEASARFVVGEVIAALKSVHDAGFVYGDLKPENVVITESGHVKITDFGACRPVTEAARQVLRESRGVVKRLRDGDWRAKQPREEEDEEEEKMQVDDETKGDEGEEAEDERIEGTYAYLPPEVIRDGTLPDQLADAWALGCLLFHCVAGRPPIFANINEDVRTRVVSFALEDGLRALLEDPSLSQSVKGLVTGLLTTDKPRRFTIEAAGLHAFFTDEGVDVYALHRGPAVPFAMGAAAPNPDAAWNRRQFSSIWAPLPGSYSFVSPSYALCVIPESDDEFGSPFSYDTYMIQEERRGSGSGPELPRRPSRK